MSGTAAIFVCFARVSVANPAPHEVGFNANHLFFGLLSTIAQYMTAALLMLIVGSAVSFAVFKSEARLAK